MVDSQKTDSSTWNIEEEERLRFNHKLLIECGLFPLEADKAMAHYQEMLPMEKELNSVLEIILEVIKERVKH